MTCVRRTDGGDRITCGYGQQHARLSPCWASRTVGACWWQRGRSAGEPSRLSASSSNSAISCRVWVPVFVSLPTQLRFFPDKQLENRKTTSAGCVGACVFVEIVCRRLGARIGGGKRCQLTRLVSTQIRILGGFAHTLHCAFYKRCTSHNKAKKYSTAAVGGERRWSRCCFCLRQV